MGRRRFIFEMLAQRKELPLSRIFEEFPGTNPQSIKDDIEHLTRIGLPIVKKKVGREVILVDDSSSHHDVKQIRANVRILEKEMLAKMAVGLICGFPPDNDSNSPPKTALPTHFRDCPSRMEIRTQLDWCAGKTISCSPHANKVKSCLDQLWDEHNRFICLDSGTTNDKISDLLFELPIPTEFTQLSRLTVCTNDTSIFQKLGDSRCPIGSIIIGGQKRARTDTIAGVLAENFCKGSNLQFAITIVGAAIMDMQHFHACSDSQEEANLKAILFQRSSLRVLCIDNSKLTLHPMREAYSFAAITPEQIDLIITNCPRTKDSLDKEKPTAHELMLLETATKGFESMIRSILKKGVPVLLAESAETHQVTDLIR